MRQIILDTETTGLEPEHGHRIIEIGALEMVDRRLTGEKFHVYLNPDREIDEGAMEVHGITTEFLRDKPRFSEVADEFLEFLADAELLIHNAPFDLGFLDHELQLLGSPYQVLTGRVAVTDTLELARDLHPGQRNSLDALCKRYEVDNSSRTLHGALLDAEILAEVYLCMTGGQVDLALSLEPAREQGAVTDMPAERPVLRILKAQDAERAAHEARLDAIEKVAGDCAWRALAASDMGKGTA